MKPPSRVGASLTQIRHSRLSYKEFVAKFVSIWKSSILSETCLETTDERVNGAGEGIELRMQLQSVLPLNYAAAEDCADEIGVLSPSFRRLVRTRVGRRLTR